MSINRTVVTSDTSSLLKGKGVNGKTVTANVGPDIVILKNVSKEELGKLLSEFRKLQHKWLISHLIEMVGSEHAPGLPWGLAPHLRDGEPRLFTHLVSGAIPSKAWDAVPSCNWLGGTNRNKALLSAPFSQQQEFLRVCVGSSVAEAATVLREPTLTIMALPRLENDLAQSSGAEEFAGVLAELDDAERVQDGRDRKRCQIPGFLLHHLSHNGVLLLPPRNTPFVGSQKTRDLADMLLPPASAEMARMAINGEKNGLAGEEDRLRKAANACHVLFGSSTIREPGDICPELAGKIRDTAEAGLPGTRKALDFYSRACVSILRGAGMGSAARPPNRNREAITKSSRLWWAKQSGGGNGRGLLPGGLAEPYVPDDGMRAWADKLESYLSSTTRKSETGARTAFTQFLVWMWNTGRSKTIAGPDGIRRRGDILEPKKDDGSGQCLRSWLASMDVEQKTKNTYLVQISQALDWIIADEDLQIPNPIDLKTDLFQQGAKATRTTREAMSVSDMRRLVELNRRGNVGNEFSLSRRLDVANVRTSKLMSADGDSGKAWVPVLPVLIELLLHYPMRGFQGRFADSGEGDEFVCERVDGEPVWVPNTNPLATKGRQEGILRAFKRSDGTLVVGIHANTNKTPILGEAGYDVPYCLPEIEESIRMLARWQTEKNPVSEPIVCAEKTSVNRAANKETLDALKKTYPLFRDPDDDRNWAVGSQKVAKYWTALCEAADEELVSREKLRARFMLTDQHGNREPRYKIHHLRVSGITAWLEAGMDPAIVKQLSGHETLAMVLHYHAANVDKIQAAVEKANEGFSHMSSIGNEDASVEAVEQMASGFFNIAGGRVANGTTVLSEIGWRDGESFHLMPHGICPGGDCKTGGRGGEPLPRTRACSLCRWRLTGPSFMAGLAANCNSLLWEIRELGMKVEDTNRRIAEAEKSRMSGSSTVRADNKTMTALGTELDMLLRSLDALVPEWAAEIQYVEKALAGFGNQDPASSGNTAGTGKTMELFDSEGKALVSSIKANAGLEECPELTLLQGIVENAVIHPAFAPHSATEAHDRILNQILGPTPENLLVELSGRTREIAAMLIGKAICAFVPGKELGTPSAARTRLSRPEIRDVLSTVTAAARAGLLTDEPAMAKALPNVRGTLVVGDKDWLVRENARLSSGMEEFFTEKAKRLGKEEQWKKERSMLGFAGKKTFPLPASPEASDKNENNPKGEDDGTA